MCLEYFLITALFCFDKTARRPPPRVTTPEEDRRIIEAADGEVPLTNAAKLKETLGLDASVCTIRRRLHEANIHCRKPARKERHTDQHRLGRLQFAREHLNEGEDFWAKVVFVDEKTFRSSDHGPLRVWRRDNTR